MATKVAPSDGGSGFLPDQVQDACDASLARLGIDVIDLYQLHWPDESGVPIEDTWGAMVELVAAGKIRFAGVSNFDRELLERCLAIRHVDSLQQEFSMLALEDRDLIRWCGEQGIGVVSYSPLGVGFLTGRYTRASAAAIDDWRSGEAEWTSPARLDAVFAIVDGLRPIAERLGITMGQLALAWNISQPGVTAAIAGSRSGEHMRQNADAGDLALDAATIAEVEGAARRASDRGFGAGPRAPGARSRRAASGSAGARRAAATRACGGTAAAPASASRRRSSRSAGPPSSADSSPKKSPGNTSPTFLPFRLTLPLPDQHDEQGLAEHPLLDDHLPLVERELVGLGGQPLEVLLREAREQRDRGQRGGVLTDGAPRRLLGLAGVHAASRPAKQHVGCALTHGSKPTPASPPAHPRSPFGHIGGALG